MNKSKIIYNIIIIILIIALIIMAYMYYNMKKMSQNNFDSILESADELFEANKRIQELEEELEQYKNTNITTTDNTVSSAPYIPDGMSVADFSNSSEIKASDMEFNRSPEKVTIEVLKDIITNASVEILITDNNEDSYGWGVQFAVQEKVNGEWKDLEYISDDIAWIDIAYNLDKNNQLKQKLNIEKYYGKLEKGIYRIVKSQWDNEYIDLYSNEFEIK